MRWLGLIWPMAFALAYALGLHRALSLDALTEHRRWLQAVVSLRPAASAAGFVAMYTVIVAFSLPGATVLTVAGGLLFGTVAGAACAVTGATLGGILLFLAARYVLGEWLSRRAGPVMARLRAGLERDGFSTLLAIRLTPIVPFWLANLAPALAGMRLLPFALATLLGISPATVVFASVGAGLGAVLDQGGTPDLSIVLRPSVVLPLLGLAALSLLPVVVRRWR